MDYLLGMGGACLCGLIACWIQHRREMLAQPGADVYVSLYESGHLDGNFVRPSRLLGLCHALYDASRFVGLRDRLRCPRCKSVGAWKPHGGQFDLSNGRLDEDGRAVKRWLCKWCGLYVGPEGVCEARMGSPAWVLDGGDVPPIQACRNHYNRTINPWVG